MNVDTDRIRQRAYEIWIADGCPAGKEVEHWKRAEQELFAETNDVGTTETGGNGQGQKQQTELERCEPTERGATAPACPSRAPPSQTVRRPQLSLKGGAAGPSFHAALILRFCNAVGGIRSLF